MPIINYSLSNKTMPSDSSSNAIRRHTTNIALGLKPPGMTPDKNHKHRNDSGKGSRAGSKTRIIISNTVSRESNKQDANKPEVIITKVEKHQQSIKATKNDPKSRRGTTVEYIVTNLTSENMSNKGDISSNVVRRTQLT